MKERELAIGWQGAEHLEMRYACIDAEELSGDCFGKTLPGLIIDLRHIRRAAGRATGERSGEQIEKGQLKVP
jgi:hypothetical protein